MVSDALGVICDAALKVLRRLVGLPFPNIFPVRRFIVS
jgi:hypothetical protein